MPENAPTPSDPQLAAAHAWHDGSVGDSDLDPYLFGPGGDDWAEWSGLR